jgi:F-type H+-transporting ATPase subunit epsilon
MNSYTVDILTPSKVIARGVVAESLLVETSRGQINILKDHTHMITNLGTGQVSIFGGESDPDRFFSVTKGICKVLNDKVTILADTSEESHEIDVERATQSLENAKNILATSDSLTDVEIEKYRRKVERAQLRLQLATFVRDRNI